MGSLQKKPMCAQCDQPVDHWEVARLGNKVVWKVFCHGKMQMMALSPTLTGHELTAELELVFVRPSVLFEDRT